ncbi:hypothetical protein BRYFOR_09322 [Marvinbryantia formatexigens DSM 14469]|uniref:Uncharacterized protein n=1 Tax=Marvinbryantia formatexigens DSM 14469 TaxID=478749 RepID=C6LKX5_9FIRM|nr:hypothetical protein BRYFOR_09322 [Marvinbryantia formatexigens DSM 14469]
MQFAENEKFFRAAKLLKNIRITVLSTAADSVRTLLIIKEDPPVLSVDNNAGYPLNRRSLSDTWHCYPPSL